VYFEDIKNNHFRESFCSYKSERIVAKDDITYENSSYTDDELIQIINKK